MNTNKRPHAVNQIFEIFRNHQIYLVGGCVRDQLLGRKIKDWDFATNLVPLDVMKLLESRDITVVPTGISYGTITAVVDGDNYEITTFRQDVETDGRRATTKFTDDLELDSWRRDLTINALYMDGNNKIIDFHQGQNDLLQKKLRFVGVAEGRITEDYLRILRFFRFQNALGFTPDFDHQQCCFHYSDKILQYVAVERIWVELVKIFACPDKTLFSRLQNQPQVVNFFHSLGWTFKTTPTILKYLPHSGHIYNMQSCFQQDSIPDRFKISSLERQLYQLYRELYSQDGELLDKILKKILLHNTNIDKKYLQQLISSSPHLNRVFENYADRQFPVRGQDLVDLGYRGPDITKIYRELKSIWFEQGYDLDHQSLLNIARAKKDSLV